MVDCQEAGSSVRKENESVEKSRGRCVVFVYYMVVLMVLLTLVFLCLLIENSRQAGPSPR
jgi:hypothetical protein